MCSLGRHVLSSQALRGETRATLRRGRSVQLSSQPALPSLLRRNASSGFHRSGQMRRASPVLRDSADAACPPLTLRSRAGNVRSWPGPGARGDWIARLDHRPPLSGRSSLSSEARRLVRAASGLSNNALPRSAMRVDCVALSKVQLHSLSPHPHALVPDRERSPQFTSSRAWRLLTPPAGTRSAEPSLSSA